MAPTKTVIYLVRRDLRVADNPILHYLGTTRDHGFTHLLPVYIFPAHQVELSGFICNSKAVNPYPPPRSKVGNFWRCGPYRAAFIAESVWQMKLTLETLGSGLCVRVGSFPDVVGALIDGLKRSGYPVGAVWMTEHEGTEEKSDEKHMASMCEANGAEFKLWTDEKYYMDDRDLDFNASESPAALSSYTAYLNHLSPFRLKSRPPLENPSKGSLPSFPSPDAIPTQSLPFIIPDTLDELKQALVDPVAILIPFEYKPDSIITDHPLKGGELSGMELLDRAILSGLPGLYKGGDELLGGVYSTNLSCYLAQGCITARQINSLLVRFEDGLETDFKDSTGFGKGESAGTSGIRRGLLWRDYFRLCHQRDGDKIFWLGGPKRSQAQWNTADAGAARPDQDPDPDRIAHILTRFQSGTTGLGLIDASQRELLLKGYTANRTRHNVANFLAKLLGIDWRYGAEWYEFLLTDYDVSSNWGNWQYIAGVGSDPRGSMRTFNAVKQAFTYDSKGKYTRSWVGEVRDLQKLENVFQISTTDAEELAALGVGNDLMVIDPVLRVVYDVDNKPKPTRHRRRGKPKAKARDTGGDDRPTASASSESSLPPVDESHPDGLPRVAEEETPPARGGLVPRGPAQSHGSWLRGRPTGRPFARGAALQPRGGSTVSRGGVASLFPRASNRGRLMRGSRAISLGRSSMSPTYTPPFVPPLPASPAMTFMSSQPNPASFSGPGNTLPVANSPSSWGRGGETIRSGYRGVAGGRGGRARYHGSSAGNWTPSGARALVMRGSQLRGGTSRGDE